MESVPGYVSVIFILTTFACVAILLQTIKSAGLETFPARLLLFLLPLWILFQAALSIGGFFQKTDALPPRMFVFGALPALVIVLVYATLFRSSFVERLPLRMLTLVHVVRIPVESVLYWLSLAGAVPKVMTFAGANFDIISGILAVFVFAFGFRGGRVNKPMLIAFNVIGLVLLMTIVTVAVLSVPSPIQKMSFDQPNIAVLYFPYAMLPTIVVPIVLFSHIAALYKTLRQSTDR